LLTLILGVLAALFSSHLQAPTQAQHQQACGIRQTFTVIVNRALGHAFHHSEQRLVDFLVIPVKIWERRSTNIKIIRNSR
jgi:hypothetical protein